MLKLRKNQSLKVVVNRTLKNTLYIISRDPIKKTDMFFMLQVAALKHLVGLFESNELSKRDHLLLFDDCLNMTTEFYDKCFELTNSSDNFMLNVINHTNKCLFLMVKLGAPLFSSTTITDSVFRFVGKYCQLLHLTGQNNPQSFIYFFEMLVNSKLHFINHRFNEYNESRTLLFVLTVNLVSFIKDKRNLVLLYYASDFYGEGACERLVTNTLELFNNLIKLDGEDKTIIKNLESDILSIVNDYLSETKVTNKLTEAINFIQEAKRDASRPKAYKAFIKKNFAQNTSKNPLLLYFIYPEFCGEVLSSIIGGEDEESKRCLHSFISHFDFKGLTVLEALREVFLIFKMKGETQMIERILSGFADKYCIDNGGHSDTVFALMFAYLMLNTDHHTADIKEKMNYVSFLKNVRYVADENYLSDEKVKEAYDSICESEIKYFDLEKLQQKPHIFHDFDWRYVIETKQKIKNIFYREFMPMKIEQELNDIVDNPDIINATISSQLRHLFERRFFNNITFVLQSNLYNYQMIELLIDFFKNQSEDIRRQKISQLVKEAENIDYDTSGRENFWTFESIMLILALLLDDSNFFASMFLNMYFKHYKIIYFYTEDEYLNNVRSKADIISKNTKENDRASKSIAKVFKGFLNIDSGDEDMQRDEIEKRNIDERKKKLGLKPNKQMLKYIIANFPAKSSIFKKVLDDLYYIVYNTHENIMIKPLVHMLHILKDIAIKTKKERFFILYKNFLFKLKNLKFEVASHLSEALKENVDYLLACSLIYLELLVKNLNSQNESKNKQNNNLANTHNQINDDNADKTIDDSLSSFENINSETEIQDRINTEFDFSNHLKQTSPSVLNYIIEELIELLSIYEKVNNSELVKLINMILSCLSDKRNVLQQSIDFKKNLHNFLTKSSMHIVSENLSESLFYIFQIAETTKNLIDIDVLSIYYPVLDSIKANKDLSNNTKNHLLLLTFEKLDLENEPLFHSLKSFLGLINTIVRQIDYSILEISKLEYVIENIFKIEKIINTNDVNYEELLDSTNYLLTKNTNILHENKLIQRYLLRYVDMIALFLNRLDKKDIDLVK